MNSPSFSSFHEHLSSLYQNRDPNFNLPPLDFNQENKNYWKLVSTAIITPFAPKYKIYDFKKYIRDIQTPLISFYRNRLNSDDRPSNDEFQTNPENNSSKSSLLHKENSRLLSFNEYLSPQKLIINSEQSTFKKSHSFVDEYEDLLTTLTTNAHKNAEDSSLRSFTNFQAFEKIKPRLRSFLFLSHSMLNHSNQTQMLPTQKQKKPVMRLNKLILEVRRKSCGCKLCGGFCKKLHKDLNFLTEKESKTVIENQQKLVTKPPELKKETLTASSNKKKYAYLVAEKRPSIEEQGKSYLKVKRNTADAMENRRKDSLEVEEQITPIILKYTSVRAKLSTILNFNQYKPINHIKNKKNGFPNQSDVQPQALSIHKKSLREISETSDKFPSLIPKSSKKLSYLIGDRIKNSAQKSLREESPLNASIKKLLLTKNENSQTMEKLKLSKNQLDLHPYNNKYFFGLTKKLNLIKSGNSTSRSFIKNRKK